MAPCLSYPQTFFSRPLLGIGPVKCYIYLKMFNHMIEKFFSGQHSKLHAKPGAGRDAARRELSSDAG